MYNHYNKVDEKALARQIHGANHGEGLPQKNSRPVTAAATAAPSEVKSYVISSYGIRAADIHVENNLIDPEPTSDSERMIRMLDSLAYEYQELSFKASRKLDKFTEPQPAVDGTEAEKYVDSRQCSSSYFRILESRVERLRYTLEYLTGLVNSISTPEDRPLGSGQTNC